MPTSFVGGRHIMLKNVGKDFIGMEIGKNHTAWPLKIYPKL